MDGMAVLMTTAMTMMIVVMTKLIWKPDEQQKSMQCMQKKRFL